MCVYDCQGHTSIWNGERDFRHTHHTLPFLLQPLWVERTCAVCGLSSPVGWWYLHQAQRELVRLAHGIAWLSSATSLSLLVFMTICACVCTCKFNSSNSCFCQRWYAGHKTCLSFFPPLPTKIWKLWKRFQSLLALSDGSYIRNMKRMHFIVAKGPKNTTFTDLCLDIMKRFHSWGCCSPGNHP